ncbi:VOC family protein [Leisingera methylohalidivorans]|uniref:Glyoxalase n=1 Tax=Leisingera methylohalidivorans DSM 14336 TaxID=999552 RepID=V9VXM0_9RHOB|nr:glyoxalase/bleomycin resistance/dioxygenase family protein [Leisingera methylohalidivorans]AHD02688.1 glyoxalase [Leisingera methylohalidivorans DSM 14336]
MDYENADADSFGRSLRGIGLNLPVRDVPAEISFLETAFSMRRHQVSKDFAIVTYGGQMFQLHSDGTYAENPLLTLLPENPPRGAGVEILLYDSDQDHTAARAEALGHTVLQLPADKPHGLREAYILSENGYAGVPSRPKG